MHPILLAILNRFGLITVPVYYKKPQHLPIGYREGDNYTVTDLGLKQSSQPNDQQPGHENHF
jgi:hypothetical protein